MCLTPEEYNQMLKDAWKKSVNNIRGYHIHIYYDQNDPQSEFTAQGLSQAVINTFDEENLIRHEVGVVGPHINPNIELDIKPDAFGKILQYLQMNNYGLSIVVHPETGDVTKDHLENSIWILSQTLP